MAGLLTQLRRYSMAGVFNTLLGYGVIFALMGLSVSALVANVVGYSVALVLAFVLNRQWVFEAAGNLSGQAFRFLAAFVVCFAINYGVLITSIDNAVNPYLSQLVAGACYSVFFFVFSRQFVFRRPLADVTE